MKTLTVFSLAAAMVVSLGGSVFAACSDGHASAPQQTVMADPKTQTTPATPVDGRK